MNVNSAEELNQIMAEFPLGAAGEIKILPLVDFEEAINQSKKAMMAMVKR